MSLSFTSSCSRASLETYFAEGAFVVRRTGADNNDELIPFTPENSDNILVPLFLKPFKLFRKWDCIEDFPHTWHFSYILEAHISFYFTTNHQ